jgi:hypothetical protein
VALAFIPTGVITFFKTGPFTYSGILGFYIPLIIFSVWLLAMPYAVYRAIRDEVPPADESIIPGSHCADALVITMDDERPSGQGCGLRPSSW